MVIATSVAVSGTPAAFASGGSGGGGGTVSVPSVNPPKVDTIKVTKAYINGGGEMLIKASSSDPTAQLSAFRPDGTLIGQVQNGGGSRYGETVMSWQSYDPGTVTITSTSGGSITVPTTPFQI